MNTKTDSENEMLDVLANVEAGTSIREVARLTGVAQATIHRPGARSGGMTRDDATRVRPLEEEHRPVKKLVADLALDHSIRGKVPRENVVKGEHTLQAQTPVGRRVVGLVQAGARGLPASGLSRVGRPPLHRAPAPHQR